MSTRLGWWVSVPMLLALGGKSLVALSAEYEGKPIASIQFEPEKQPLSRDQLMAMISLRPGQALQGSDVRATIERLYRTGEYADIAVDATAAPSGVILKIVTKPSFFVGHVAVNGVPEPPNEGQLVLATKLELGAAYSSDQLKAASDRLQELVRRNGFYHSDTQAEIDTEAVYQQVNINFSIDPGKRAKFDGLKTTGDSERSPESLIRATGWKRFRGLFGWHDFTETRLRNGLDNIRSWYPKHDHLLARVQLINLNYHDSSNTVTPEVNIDSGARVEVRLHGAKMSAGKLRGLLPIYEERAVDRDLLEEGSRDLASYFQSQGYFDAMVSYTTSTPRNAQEYIDYTVETGSRHKIVRLEITGNHYFDRQTLRERLSVIPASPIRYRYGRYSRNTLERDVEGIRTLYRANGFRDIDVQSREIDNYQGKPNHIGVVIEIKEGPQWFVSTLDIEGASPDDRSALQMILRSIAGQPYSETNVALDREAALDYYFNQGYPRATFEFISTPAAQPQRIDLKYVIAPGPREYVRNVVVSGLQRTRADVVRSRIDLRPGDPLSQDKITGSQRRLYDLGIFARVDAALQNPDGEEPDKNVLYSVAEAHRYNISYGFGAEIGRIGGGTTSLESPAGTTGFSPRFSFGISRLNFLGTGHTVGLQTLISTLEQRGLLTYLAPEFEGKRNLSLQFTGLFDISHDVRTFSARREEGSVQLGQKLSRVYSLQYRYTFRKVNILGTPLITPELIPLLSQPVRVGLIATTIIQDRRDDPVDAHRGLYNSLDLALASNLLGSQTGYGRLLARNSTYHPLTKNLVFARSTSFGLIQGYAGLPEIPLSERFFGGGSFSNRAFPDFQAGPRDLETGFPIGGNALLVNTVELRFPLLGENIGGVLFNDVGNVYSAVNKISFRFNQRDLQDFDYGVQGFGFGVRYRTPIGPVRADFSFSPNSPRFFGFKGTENQLLYGGGQAVVQRINAFQFHFSLGQAF
ncbi:MAG TPA: POTRA domain-containing protein [Bryobacteraceae bacterium]|nr:POTRA domain-containing protein [Bryobacteraceae bacterium]